MYFNPKIYHEYPCNAIAHKSIFLALSDIPHRRLAGLYQLWCLGHFLFLCLCPIAIFSYQKTFPTYELC